MKTKEEIKEEIIELYGANKALSDALNHLRSQQIENTKKLYALNHMLGAMKEGDKDES
jgi:hypothetical protein